MPGQVLAADTVSKLQGSVRDAVAAVGGTNIPLLYPNSGTVGLCDVHLEGRAMDLFLRHPDGTAFARVEIEYPTAKVFSLPDGRLQQVGGRFFGELKTALDEATRKAKDLSSPVLQLLDLQVSVGRPPDGYNPYLSHHRNGTIAYLTKLIFDHGSDGVLTLSVGAREEYRVASDGKGGVRVSKNHLDGRDTWTFGKSITVTPKAIVGGGYASGGGTFSESANRAGPGEAYLWSALVGQIREIEEQLGVRFPVA